MACRFVRFVFVCVLLWTGGSCAWAEEDSLERDYSAELPRIAPVEPQDALATFEAQPGFRMELVAAEPLVRDPVAMAFDEYGRLFVVEMRGYSEERDKLIGAVRMLVDEDGDGVYDASSVYVDGLAWPVAVACYNGGVFVGVPPDILYCKDLDGDGRADATERVFTGFSLQNVQGMLNSFNWGLDNRIHGATSSAGAEVVRAEGSPGVPLVLRGRDFAFNPKDYTILAESGGGQHGLSFDEWGRKFVCHNSDHCQLILFEDRYVARNPFYAAPIARRSIAVDGPAADVYRASPVEPWRVLRTRLRVKGLVPGPIEGGGTAAGYFTSATGITVYKGDAWPEETRGQLIIGDVGSNLIHRKITAPDGVALIAKRIDERSEFVTSTDIWFRPVQFCNGPDGALYVADMYREVIEHPDSLPPIIKKHLDLNSGNDRGRIYRIVPEGFKQPAIPRLGDMDGAGLVAFLGHPNGWHRETAARLIYERQPKSIVAALEEMALEGVNPLGRTHALYALEGLGALSPAVVLKALTDQHPRVREHALRLAEPFAADAPEVLAAMTGLVNDGDVNVRYQLAFSLGAGAGSERNAALAALARRDGEEPLFRAAILSSAFQGAGEILGRLVSDSEYLRADYAPGFLEELARLTGASGSPEEIEGVLGRIDGLAAKQENLAGALVRGVIRGLTLAGRGSEVTGALAKSSRAAALLEGLLEDAYAGAADSGRGTAERVNAIRSMALGPFEKARDILPPLVDQREPPEVQAAALATLRRFNEPEVAAMLLSAWDGLSPRLREQAIEALFAREAWLDALLEAIESGGFNPGRLDSIRVDMLRNHRNAAVRERAQRVFTTKSSGVREQIVEAYRDSLSLPGDPARGKRLFAENCSKCHRLQGEGFEVGPDLSSVAQGGAEKILVNVLDPNREVNPQYINYTVETADWETHSGIIASENATSITLRRANGEEDTILRVNIESIVSGNLSIMPDGWEESLDKQAMADLIAYLSALE